MANNHRPSGTEYTAQLGKTFAAGFSAQNLRAQSGYPTHCPSFIVATNNAVTTISTAGDVTTPNAAQDLVFKDQSGNTVTVKLPQQTTMQIDCNASTLETSGAAVSVTAFWMVDATTRYN
jgi:hypothetical protein